MKASTRAAVLLAALLAMVCGAAAPLLAQTPPLDVPVVVTSGEGLVTSAPDRAFVGITTESRAPNPRDAQRRNAELMKPVQDKLRALGIVPEAIRTTGINLRQEFDFVNGKRVSRGYVATNSLDVRIDAIDRVGELLDGVVTAGATSVGDVRFDMKDRSKLEREALRLAVQDARARADAAASGAGRTIERILRIEEQGIPMPSPTPMRAMLMKDASQADTPISTGEIEFRARVTLTAAIR